MTTFKDMKKTITIEPFDEYMESMAKSVELLNKFKIYGLTMRKRFVSKVIETDPFFASLENIDHLQQFWLGRLRDNNINERLEAVLGKLTQGLADQLEKLKQQ
ncbi:hypothetical protein ASG38_15135 [Flavobacterium sp. Leaf359]|nr:hypothetical protein ASG38_15135 [Flavobacterium sp. Leaf359]